MSLKTRLDKLEGKLGTASGDMMLYCPGEGEIEGAELIRRPTPDRDGLARLADGSEKCVIYESGHIVFSGPGYDYWPDAILWKQRGAVVFILPGNTTEDDI